MKSSLSGALCLSLLLVGMTPMTSVAAPASKQPAFCQKDNYHCYRVKRGDTWASLFPDEEERGIAMRVNRLNISLHPGLWLVIPNDLSNGTLLEYAPFPHQIQSTQEKLLVFDPKVLAWAAYDDNGELVKWGPAAGGANHCPDIGKPCRTKSGEFRVYSVGGSNCVSSKFPIPDGGAPMPYCMFFNGGQALHGSPNGLIRKNASHGCVRLFVQDAEWLRYNFIEPPSGDNQGKGTRVVVLPYEENKTVKSQEA